MLYARLSVRNRTLGHPNRVMYRIQKNQKIGSSRFKKLFIIPAFLENGEGRVKKKTHLFLATTKIEFWNPFFVEIAAKKRVNDDYEGG